MVFKSKNPFTFFCFLVMALAFTCHRATPSEGLKAGSIVVCTSSDILSLDPTNHRDRDTQMVLKNIFDSLTTRDKHLSVVPQLAQSWQRIDDLTWEFKLRNKVKFHNGDTFSARDVKFTLDRVVKENGLDGKTSPRKSLLGRIAETRILDNDTIRITTDTPWPILPLMMTLQEIIPQNYLEHVGSKGFEKMPVGTGPFKYVEKQSDGTLFLERFDGYYGGSHQNPPVGIAPLKQLVFKPVANQVFRTALLKKGQADIITNVPLEAIPLLEMVPHVKILSQPATRSYFAELNCKKPPFNDPNLRLAVNYAMDMRQAINVMFQGKAQVLSTILLDQAFAFNDQLQPYPYDPEKANMLIDKSNLVKDNVINIVCIGKYSKFANTISLFLSKVGIKSNLIIGGTSSVRKAMKDLTADILVTSWGNTTLDPVGILLPKLKTNGRGNFSNYSNIEIDRLLDAAETTLNPEDRERYYKKIQEIIYMDAPMIFGYASQELYGVSKRVKNFYPSPTGMLDLHDVYVE